MLRYADMINDSVVDGPGIRAVVFLQGCPRHCLGCHNPGTLDQAGGVAIAPRALAKKILKALTPKHAGLTISGGDPLMQHEELAEVLDFIKKRLPDLNIWLYTGYLFEEVKDYPLMSYLDVVVDGPFIEAQKALSLVYCGSGNQRLINVPESLIRGETVAWQVDSKGRLLKNKEEEDNEK